MLGHDSGWSVPLQTVAEASRLAHLLSGRDAPATFPMSTFRQLLRRRTSASIPQMPARVMTLGSGTTAPTPMITESPVLRP